jgi:predicted metal-dependent peptidase
MNKMSYVLIDQNLYDKMPSLMFAEYVRVACERGRLDWITFLEKPVTEIPWGRGLFEVDQAGRMSLLEAFWDTTD